MQIFATIFMAFLNFELLISVLLTKLFNDIANSSFTLLVTNNYL
jgi:hypothetical protein